MAIYRVVEGTTPSGGIPFAEFARRQAGLPGLEAPLELGEDRPGRIGPRGLDRRADRLLEDLPALLRDAPRVAGVGDDFTWRLEGFRFADDSLGFAYLGPRFDEGEPLEDFTVRCAEAWRVGRKGLDDGVILFAFALFGLRARTRRR